MNEHILVIEDDKSIINFLSIALKTNGYKYDIAENGMLGISLFLANKPDIILLDLGLPDIDGTEVIKQIRSSSKIPIIVISARGQDVEKVEALDLGADDYVTKPFSINELMARVRVALRNSHTEIEREALIFESRGLKIDFERRQVFIDEEQIHLTPIEYKILVLLVQNSGKVLTHLFLQKEVWGHSEFGEPQSLRVFMANIRRKIEKDTTKPKYITTEVGVGYRFVE